MNDEVTAHSRCYLLFVNAFAQSATPKVGNKPLVEVKRKERMGCKLVGTVMGTKLWAGDCVGSELRGSTTTTQTQSLPEQVTRPGVPVVAPPNAKVGAALQRGQERQSELRSGQNTEASTAHQRIGYEVERPARIGVMRALNRHVERVFNDRKDHHWSLRKLKRDE